MYLSKLTFLNQDKSMFIYSPRFKINYAVLLLLEQLEGVSLAPSYTLFAEK